MRVVVNGRYLRQRVTGVQRYARAIVARLGDRVEVVAPALAARGIAGHLWEQTVLPCRAGRGVLWSPSATGPLSVACQVVTIHDCAFVDQPQGFTPAFARWYQCLVPRLARRARRVLTVSNFSKSRICAVCRVPEDKVTVIPNGVDPIWRPAAAEAVAVARGRAGLDAPYVLCVGSLEPRKNLARLLTAWQQLKAIKDGLVLAIAGAAGRVFRQAGLGELPADVRLLGFVPDADLPALVTGAHAFVFPSLYEGFGLPVLEAMACGTPVVCARGSALEELADGAAVLVDPEDVNAIAAGLTQILEDRTLARGLAARGLARAQQYSWDAAAHDTWEALVSAV
jgi:glycosyltransferase involved in cell wall biosynthesis